MWNLLHSFIYYTRSFPVAFPEICNFLPPALRSCNCPDTFRRHPKTYDFQQDFSSPQGIFPYLRLRFGICWHCARVVTVTMGIVWNKRDDDDDDDGDDFSGSEERRYILSKRYW